MPNVSDNLHVDIGYPDGMPPTPKQMLFHQDQGARVKLLEGGFASGKSYALIMDLIINLLQYPGNECTYGRLTLDEILRTFFPIWNELMPQALIISHNKAERKMVIKTSGEPSIFYYLPLDDSKGAKHKIKSMNLGFAAIDQAEEIAEDIIEAFLGRLRRKGTRRQLAMNANPEGHNWIWRRFIKEKGKHRKHTYYEINPWREDAPDPTEDELYDHAEAMGKDPMDLMIQDFPQYVEYTDNPFLPMDYLLDMLSWPEKTKRRYVYGKHDAFEGLIYDSFHDQTHVIDSFDTSGKEFIRVISMDWGKVNPLCVLFWDIDPNGVCYCTHEIYQTNMDVVTLKLMIRAMNRDKKVHSWVADPSIRKKLTPDQPSIDDLFRSTEDGSGWGITWSEADNSPGAVNAGIEVVQNYLKNDPFTDNKTKVFFFRDKCVELIEEIQDYRWKEMARTMTLIHAKNQPEIPRKYKDHAMDSMRYALSWIKRFDIRPKDRDINMRKFLRAYWQREKAQSGVRGHMVT
jgi:PBSX family phage terminase large subunit